MKYLNYLSQVCLILLLHLLGRDKGPDTVEDYGEGYKTE